MAREASSPGLSVVVPVHRTPLPLLRACLASIAGQRRACRHEVLVVDDGSGASYGQQLRVELAAADGVTLIDGSRHLGMPVARNRGVQAARFPYVLLLDSDDVLHCSALARLSDPVAGGADVVYADHALIDETGSRVLSVRRKAAYQSLYERYRGTVSDPTLYATFVFHPQVFRIGALLDVGGFNEDYRWGGHEQDVLLRILERDGATLQHVPAALYGYRLNPGSVVQDPVRLACLHGAVRDALRGAAERRRLPLAAVKRLGRIDGVTHYEWVDGDGALVEPPYLSQARSDLRRLERAAEFMR